MTHKFLREDIIFLKRISVLFLIEELNLGNILLIIHMSEIFQFHQDLKYLNHNLMFLIPIPLVAILLKFVIHLLDQTMSMVKEIQWI